MHDAITGDCTGRAGTRPCLEPQAAQTCLGEQLLVELTLEVTHPRLGGRAQHPLGTEYDDPPPSTLQRHEVGRRDLVGQHRAELSALDAEAQPDQAPGGADRHPRNRGRELRLVPVQPERRLGDPGRARVHLCGEHAQLTHSAVAGQPRDLRQQLHVGEPARREQPVHRTQGHAGREQPTEVQGGPQRCRQPQPGDVLDVVAAELATAAEPAARGASRRDDLHRAHLPRRRWRHVDSVHPRRGPVDRDRLAPDHECHGRGSQLGCLGSRRSDVRATQQAAHRALAQHPLQGRTLDPGCPGHRPGERTVERQA